MSSFMLDRDKRRRKRSIYGRANRALNDLNDALRDLREFSGFMKDYYSSVGAVDNVNTCLKLEQSLRGLDVSPSRKSRENVLDLLAQFNRLSEEGTCDS